MRLDLRAEGFAWRLVRTKLVTFLDAVIADMTTL